MITIETILGTRRRWFAGMFACLIAAGVASLPAVSQIAPATVPAGAGASAALPAAVSDDQVTAAIRRGLTFLLDRQKPDGRWITPYAGRFQGGPEALVVLTALSSGQTPDSTQITSAVRYLGSLDPTTVYARSLRAMVYSLLGPRYAKKLQDDVNFLVVRQGKSGGWGYGLGHETTEMMPDWTDGSNTQLAVQALRDAADAGANVPPSVWRKCRSYWVNSQRKDGGWGYQAIGEGAGLRNAGYPSMTAAGAASLQIIAGKIAPMDASDENPRQPMALEDQPAIDRALKYLSDHYQPRQDPAWPTGMTAEWTNYYLLCLTRAALASGQRTLGGQKWYAQAPAMLLSRQRPDGSWPSSVQGQDGGEIVPTCFALLCLIKSQSMVLVNKLPLSDRDSLDAENLARWMSRTTHRPATWQLLTPRTLSEAVDDAPILYISGRGDTAFPPTMDDPIRHLVESGGCVLVQPIAGDEKFLRQAQTYFTRLFPNLRAVKLAKDDPVCGLRGQLSTVPDVLCMDDGVRTRIFLLKSDFSGAWHLNQVLDSPWAFDFVGNVLLYTTDFRPWPTRLQPRLTAPRVAAGAAISKIRVARVKYDGDWNVCPRAMDRLNETMTAALSIGVEQLPPVDLNQAVPRDVDLLWLTGSVPPRLNAGQMENLGKYLDGGGTIFIDPAVGDNAFTQQVDRLLRAKFGQDCLKRLPSVHSLLTGDFLGGVGSNVAAVEFTTALAKEQKEDHFPLVWGVERNDRLAVIFSGMGVTCPVEGLSTFGCRGLATPDARRLACNALLYAIRP